jgi:diketogulonate reductase-like aldo/keto reductase
MVKEALAAGFRHLDCAEMYDNEEEVGVAIRESKIRREELFVTSKVSHGIDDIPTALDRTLAKLKLENIDMEGIAAHYAMLSY